MRLIGLMTVKNEVHRYLEDVLDFHRNIFDDIYVLDDNSDDETFEVCQGFDYVTVERPGNDVPTFMDHEGQFRQHSWERMVATLEPAHDEDWICLIDADEFLVTMDGLSVKEHINSVKPIIDGGLIPVWEIHGQSNKGKLLQRTDGFWNYNRNVARLMRYSDDGEFKRKRKAHACGCPDYYKAGGRLEGVAMLHFGYFRDEDKVAKYERYSQADSFGHNPKHIESIPNMTNFNVLDDFNVSDFLS